MTQSGNALLLILIAVALFAALSYAVSQTSRGSGTIDGETRLIAAAQVTQYPALLRTIVSRMIFSGTPATLIDFHSDDADLTRRVFDLNGGGAVYQKPPANVGGQAEGEGGPGTTVGNTTNQTWGFKDVRSGALGYWIKGVGTDSGLSGREIFIYLHRISQAVCEKINKGLGLPATPAFQSTAVDYAIGSGKGAATDASAVISGTGSANVFAAAGLSGQAFACTEQSNNKYDYYHALVEQ